MIYNQAEHNRNNNPPNSIELIQNSRTLQRLGKNEIICTQSLIVENGGREICGFSFLPALGIAPSWRIIKEAAALILLHF